MIKQNLYSVTFSESLIDYEIMSQKLVEPEKPHIIIWRRIACLIVKATRGQAHSGAHAPSPTHAHKVQYLLLFHRSSCFVKAPQWLVSKQDHFLDILTSNAGRKAETQTEDSWFFGVKLHDLVVAPDIWSSHSAFRNGDPKVAEECTLLEHVVIPETKTSSSTPP